MVEKERDKLFLNNQNFKMKPVVKAFKETIDSLNIPYVFIYLFGSQVKEEANEDSDYDFFVAISNDCDKKKIRREIAFEVHKRIPGVAFDILVRNVSEFEENQNQINSIYNTIYTEGVLIEN